MGSRTKVFNLKLGLAGLAAVLLIGCGGGGSSDSSPEPDPTPIPPVTYSLSGAAVKGPLSFAAYKIHEVSFEAEDLKGDVVASGETTELGEFTEESLDLPGNGYYLIEFLASDATIDLTTGMAPILPSLSTIVESEALEKSQDIFATPLTTIVVDLIRRANVEDKAGLSDAVKSQSLIVKSQLGFDLLDEVDLFHTPPVAFGNEADLDSILNYRTASEAAASLVWALKNESDSSTSTALELLVSDLTDGALDGLAEGFDTDVTQVVQDNYDFISRLNIGELDVPHTSDPESSDAETPLKVGSLIKLLIHETRQYDTSREISALGDKPKYTIIKAIGADLDGDGTPNEVDNDIDNDGVENENDAFPWDETESSDLDSDGVGDNADHYDADASCSLLDEGDGEACFFTLTETLALDEAFSDANGVVYLGFTENGVYDFYQWSSETQNFIGKLDLVVEGKSPQVVRYHDVHKRVYLAYSDGWIRYFSIDTPEELVNLIEMPVASTGLADAGNYLLVQDDQGARSSHHVVSKDGNLSDSKDWNRYSHYYAWNDVNSRLYHFRDGIFPNDIHFEEISQSSGSIGAQGESPYHGDYIIRGPILIVNGGSGVLLGTGDYYEAGDLSFSDSPVTSFDYGYSSSNAVVTLSASTANRSALVAYNSEFEAIFTATYPGIAEGLVRLNEAALVITYSENLGREYQIVEISDDIDGDGVPNRQDAFPNDRAASVDSDFDGAPDSWNDEYDPSLGDSDLSLDQFPSDSACYIADHGVNGVCDIQGQVQVNNVDDIARRGNVLYLLDDNSNSIWRWDTEAGEYLNPLLLNRFEDNGKAMSITVANSSSVLIGFENGKLLEFSESLPITSQDVASFDGSVEGLISTGNSYVAVAGASPDSTYLEYHLLNENYLIKDRFNWVSKPSKLFYEEESGQFYYSSHSSLYSFVINSNEMEFSDYQYSYFVESLGSWLSQSPDGQLFVTGEGGVIQGYPTDPLISPLDLSSLAEDMNAEIELLDLTWSQSIAVGLVKVDRDYFLAVFNHDLREILFKQYVDVDTYIDLIADENGVILIDQSIDNELSIVNYRYESDTDEDGLPMWWELAHGLDDNDRLDALNDSDADGLNNLEEFVAGSSPLVADTDQDGLSDFDEVITYFSNPSNSDTDEDGMPDGWEVLFGLDPLDTSDADSDLDNDSFSNLIEYLLGSDPTEESSLPSPIDEFYFSFEDQELPEGWVTQGSPQFVTQSASDGIVSLFTEGSWNISTTNYFFPVEFSLQARSTCYSIYDAELVVELNGEKLLGIHVSQTSWEKLSIPIAEGYHTLEIRVDSSASDCGILIDELKGRALPTIFEMGASGISIFENKLYVFDVDGREIKSFDIPNPNENDYTYARDAVILDDGRVAIFNGTFEPYLSVYSPGANLWEHYPAPGWSTVNNLSYGGIDAIGEQVFVTNQSTSGSPSQGYVKFDLASGSVNYFDADSFIDLTVGEDGYLYALSGNQVSQFSPESGILLSNVSIENSRAIAVDEAGNIFSATWDGEIHQFTAGGVLKETLFVGHSFNDISIRRNGELVAATAYEGLYRVAADLSSFFKLDARGKFVDVTPDWDSDSDGLPDWWEYGFGLDPKNVGDGGSDLDGDGLSALLEYTFGTHANNADTDNDGVNDGDELLIYGSNPFVDDTDADGLSDGVEAELGTSLLAQDSDNDGLTDFTEVKELGSNPLLEDSDNDGMEDMYEFEYGLNLLVDDSAGDIDADGLTNLQEYVLGSSPINIDTDGDFLSDFEESNTYGTSPVLADTDGDRMRDGWEVLYSLDPIDADDAANDEDFDSFTNIEEFFSDTSPVDSNSYPLPVVWATYQGGAAHTGYTPLQLDVDNFSHHWSVTLPNMTKLHPVVVADGKVFASNDSYFAEHRIVALDTSTGDLAWERVYDGIHSINPPAYDRGKVIFQTGGHGDSFIRGLDIDDGSLLFATKYENQWTTYMSPTVYDGGIYTAGGYYGGLYSFDLSDGSESWFTSTARYEDFTPAVDEEYVYAFITDLQVFYRDSGELAYNIEYPNFDWRGYSVNLATVLTRYNHVLSIQSGSLVVFDLDKRNILWEKTSAGFSGQPASSGGIIYALQSGILKAIDEEDGSEVWAWEASETLTSNIVVTRTHIFVGDSSHTYAINIGTQELDWSFASSGHLSLGDDGTLYIAGSELTAISLQ
ncbi:PQQ-binding-like beta-propeller repeat protein [Microbulbifer sp. EKSA005]|uniref:outer membrane protein assembly factor BamB family protein n=1 Tax=Microbulbifer sp. EKSA005 TaxID=3243364 RepID=UPI004042AF4E